MKKMLCLGVLVPALLAGQSQYVDAQRSVAASSPSVSAIDTTLAEANLGRLVTLHVKGVQLREAIDRATAMAGVDVAYRADILNAYSDPVSVNAADTPLGTVLKGLLRGKNLRVSPLAEGHIAIVPGAVEKPAVKMVATVTGRVTSTAGAPLAAVTVSIAALGVGDQTGADGRYSFTIPSARVTGQPVTLQARLLGYAAQSAQITLTDGQTVTHDFSLTVNPLHLGEVVVTGAGTSTTREKLATTINTVDSSFLRRATQPQNVVSALAGSAPGVVVRTPSGEPGASVSIKIRGVSTLSGTGQPLFVVDGQPIDNSTDLVQPGSSNGGVGAVNRAADINPNDIASIDILKGSAASSIYGARASNGVVLITTKHGQAGKTRVSISSTETFDNAVKNIKLQTKYGQGTHGVAQAPGCGTFAPTCTPASWGAVIPAGTPIYDHQAELYRTGLTADNNIQISGGNDQTTYFISGGLLSQIGVFKGPHNKYNRANVRGKGTQRLGSNFSITGNLAYIDTRANNLNRSDNPDGILLDALRTPPDFNNFPYLDPLTGLHRSYRMPNPLPGTETVPRVYDNPFFVLNVPIATSEVGRFIGNVNANWTPFSWLNVRETFGADYYDDNRIFGQPLTTTLASAGQVTQAGFNHLELDQNLVATAIGHITPNITNTLTLGQNLNSRRNRTLRLTGNQLVAPMPFAIQNTVTITGSNDQSLVHIIGYFVQDEVDLWDQLYLTAGVRDDGFSTFGSAKRSFLFPKLSAAWDVTRALGKTDRSGLLSYAKLRLAYGETGKEPDVYALSNTLTNAGSISGTISGDAVGLILSGQPGLVTGSFGNPDLRPERQRENEYGADLGFFDQRITLSGTYYNKRSTDVILPISTNAFGTGATSLTTNAAAISNKGIELALSLRPYTSKNVDWTVNVNYSKNHGDVLSLAGQQIFPFSFGEAEGFGGAAVGYTPGVLLGNDFARCGRGLVINGTDIDAACGSAPKGALYLAANGQPITDPTLRVIADPNPKHVISYSSTLTLWNKLTISTLVDAHVGGQVYNSTLGGLTRFGNAAVTLDRDQQGVFGKNVLQNVYPTVAGPGAGVVAFKTPSDWENWYSVAGSNLGTNYQFVEDGSFVKWRELSLSYTVDAPFVRRTGFSSLDLRIAGRNLHTWTRYTGTDPETSLEGGYTITQGFDYFNMPPIRSLVLSVSLNR